MNLDDSNTALKNVYEKNENYKIVINDRKNKNCIIFFSGNGLYYPDSIEVFNEIIVNKNRYEWEQVSKSEEMTNHFGMMIFVRDIYKTFTSKESIMMCLRLMHYWNCSRKKRLDIKL